MKRYIKPIVKAVRDWWSLATGRDIRVEPDLVLATERLGSAYGGWEIVTRGMDSNTIVYSCGVGDDISFDLDVINKYGVTIHAFDPTPRSIEWVASQAIPRSFSMHAYGIAARDGTLAFNPPIDPSHISYTVLDRPATAPSAIEVDVKRIASIAKELGTNRIDVLKMDIEGAEYEVIDDLAQTDIRPGQILIEFHHRFPGVGAKKTRAAIDTIRSMGYLLYAVSETNEEFSFIHKNEWESVD